MVILLGACGIPARSEPPMPSIPPSSPPTALERGLSTRISLEFQDTPLRDAIDTLHARTGMKIVVDEQALQEEGIASTAPVTMKLEEVSTKSTLNLLLHDLHLTWMVQDDSILVTTQKKAYPLVTKTYEVADLLPYLENRPVLAFENGDVPQSSQERLLHLIKNAIAPGSWHDCGGAGTVAFLKPGKVLTVSQTLDMHEQVEALLDFIAKLPSSDLKTAHDLYRRSEFAKARIMFADIADTDHASDLGEEARYYEAECLRHLDLYPRSADTYHQLLVDFPAGNFREQAVAQLFDIANFWLEDTRVEIEAVEELTDGKRWVVFPALLHFARAKPVFDEEGRAVQVLEWVARYDREGTLAAKALFLAGSVRFFRADFQAADGYFAQLIQQYPKSPYATRAGELSSSGSRTVPAGRDAGLPVTKFLLDHFHFPPPVIVPNGIKLAAFVDKKGLTNQTSGGGSADPAQRDFARAEFYRRTNHPQPATYYYERVCQGYPGTVLAEQALAHLRELSAATEATAAHP